MICFYGGQWPLPRPLENYGCTTSNVQLCSWFLNLLCYQYFLFPFFIHLFNTYSNHHNLCPSLPSAHLFILSIHFFIQSVYLSIHLIHPFIHPFIYPSHPSIHTYIPTIHPSIHHIPLPSHPCIQQPPHSSIPSIQQATHSSIPSIHPSTISSIHLSSHPPTHPSHYFQFIT